jgi:flagellar motility protein MotE (MotC chaperone)
MNAERRILSFECLVLSSQLKIQNSQLKTAMFITAWLVAMWLLNGAAPAFGQTLPKGPAAGQAEAIPPELLPPAGGSSSSKTAVPGQPLGPALESPREILDMLDQRKRMLDRKEEALRVAEARLVSLKSEIEQILAQHEQEVKTTEAARLATATTKKAADQKQAKAEADARQASLGQLAKMYETMPPEEAAARLEKMPQERALQLLRLLKGKTAGAILALVRPEKAAKLTERFMAKP